MAVTKYQFNMPADIASVDIDTLTRAINGSSIAPKTVDHIDVGAVADKLDIYMSDELDAGEETTLHGDTTAPCGGLLGAHTGVADPCPLTFPPVTFAQLPTATSHEGCGYYVTDASGNATPVWSNGSDWIRFDDNTVVSAS